MIAATTAIVTKTAGTASDTAGTSDARTSIPAAPANWWANGVTSPLGAGGSLSATYGAAAPGDTTALLLDVTGFFH